MGDLSRPLPQCLSILLSFYPFVLLPFRPSTLSSFYPFVLLPFRPSILFSFCPSVLLSFKLPTFNPSFLNFLQSCNSAILQLQVISPHRVLRSQCSRERGRVREPPA